MMTRLFILLFILFSTTLFGQNKEVIDLVITEDSWRQEAFRFPKPFAKEVNFNGVADVRFTKGWGDQTSPLFWSYTFTWKIVLDKPLTEEEIEDNMQLYFDGLMTAVNQDTSLVVPNTVALFASHEDQDKINYKGKIRLFDAFFSKDLITLNVNGHYELCSQTGHSIYMFRLSPQDLGHITWEHINKTVLKTDVCH